MHNIWEKEKLWPNDIPSGMQRLAHKLVSPGAGRICRVKLILGMVGQGTVIIQYSDFPGF